MLKSDELILKIKTYNKFLNPDTLNKAYDFALKAHEKQKRDEGSPYIIHPIAVADILTELKLDSATIATGLLHDTIEDTHATYNTIESEFGKEVADLVDGVTKISVFENQAISNSKAENLRNNLEQKGSKIYLIKADLGKEKDVLKIIKFAKKNMGYLDCLINNASVFENDKIENFNSKSWNNHLNANLKAPAILSKEFSKCVVKGNNNIINIIDQRVFKLTPYFFSYTLSKAGLYTMTKTSAMSFAPRIRVNGIAPGPTIKNKRQSVAHFKKQYLATPLRKQVNVNDICNAVDFLIKNRSITGQVLALDSGQSLNWQTPDILGGKE